MTDGWSTATRAQVADRLTRPDLGRWLTQVEQVRNCSHPVRLSGSSDTIDTATGEVLASYSSNSEPDGVTYVRCGNRRASVCPSCSHEYKGDVWHVLIAGAAGGMKDVPATVATHPLVFATFTAPSFGLVHAAKKPGRPGSRRCMPRSGDRRQVCPHGRPRWCMAVHDRTDPVAGQPLCAECYDYAGHLVWQWWAPELWRRFTIALRRRLAAHLGLTETVARDRVRVQFAKVAEFQRRGIIHFHALIRLDGPPTDEAYPAPTVEVASQTLAELVAAAARSVWCDAAPVDGEDRVRRLRFGAELDARAVTGSADRETQGSQLHPETVAAYIAKYATKAAADLPTDRADRNDHLRRLKVTLRDLAGRAAITAIAGMTTDGNDAYKGWGRWGDMLGFRGHLATKSRRYSITLGRLRQARRDYSRRRQLVAAAARPAIAGDDQDDAEGETTLVVGSWRFAGMGWLTAGDAALAAASAARARDD
jgi:hypothetical protein